MSYKHDKKSEKKSKSGLNLNKLSIVILWSVFYEEFSESNSKAGNIIWKNEWTKFWNWILSG